MKSLLSDTNKFKKIDSDNNLKHLNHSQGLLLRLRNKEALSQEVYKRIRPTLTTIPTLYGLPKVHKDYNPMRPILSSISSYNHECADWLSEILTPLRHHQSSVKDTLDFLQNISNLSITNKVMAILMLKVFLTIKKIINLVLYGYKFPIQLPVLRANRRCKYEFSDCTMHGGYMHELATR